MGPLPLGFHCGAGYNHHLRPRIHPSPFATELDSISTRKWPASTREEQRASLTGRTLYDSLPNHLHCSHTSTRSRQNGSHVRQEAPNQLLLYGRILPHFLWMARHAPLHIDQKGVCEARTTTNSTLSRSIGNSQLFAPFDRRAISSWI